MLTKLTRSQPEASTAAACLQRSEPCGDVCPLQACKNGNRAVVVSMDCPTPEACRLRALGVYEGARVSVVDSRNGLLLQVRGSRLAIGAAVAAAISVIPIP